MCQWAIFTAATERCVNLHATDTGVINITPKGTGPQSMLITHASV